MGRRLLITMFYILVVVVNHSLLYFMIYLNELNKNFCFFSHEGGVSTHGRFSFLFCFCLFVRWEVLLFFYCISHHLIISWHSKVFPKKNIFFRLIYVRACMIFLLHFLPFHDILRCLKKIQVFCTIFLETYFCKKKGGGGRCLYMFVGVGTQRVLVLIETNSKKTFKPGKLQLWPLILPYSTIFLFQLLI